MIGLADTNISTMTETPVTFDQAKSAVQGVTDTAPKPEEEKKAEAPKPGLSSWQVLARKEKQIIQDRERIAAEKESLRRDRQEIQALKQRMESFEAEKASFKTNPKKLYEAYGLTYDELTQAELNNGEVPPSVQIKALQDHIKNLEDRLQTEKTQEEQIRARQAEEQNQQVLADFQDQIVTFVKSKPENYELILLNGAEDLVYSTVNDYYEKTKKIISIKEAADATERFLENKAEEIARSKKVRARLGSAVEDIRRTPEPAKTRTLSNTYTPISAPQYGQTAKSEQERMERAARALDGTRK